MALYIKPGDTYEVPEDIRIPGAGGVMESVPAVRTKSGGIWEDVWPEYEQAVHYLMLYDHGDECTEITGGWSANGYSRPNDGATWTVINATKQSDKMYFKNPASLTYAGFGTVKAVNLSNYPQLYILITGLTVEPSYGFCGEMWHGTTKSFTNTTYQGIQGTGKHIVKFTKNQGGTKYTFLGCNSPGESFYLHACFAVGDDDWQTWLSKAGLSSASLEAVMSDAAMLTTLLSSWRATNYMLRQCTGDVMVAAVQSATFKTALEVSPYKDRVYANDHWSKFLAMI